MSEYRGSVVLWMIQSGTGERYRYDWPLETALDGWEPYGLLRQLSSIRIKLEAIE